MSLQVPVCLTQLQPDTGRGKAKQRGTQGVRGTNNPRRAVISPLQRQQRRRKELGTEIAGTVESMPASERVRWGPRQHREQCSGGSQSSQKAPEIGCPDSRSRTSSQINKAFEDFQKCFYDSEPKRGQRGAL